MFYSAKSLKIKWLNKEPKNPSNVLIKIQVYLIDFDLYIGRRMQIKINNNEYAYTIFEIETEKHIYELLEDNKIKKTTKLTAEFVYFNEEDEFRSNYYTKFKSVEEKRNRPKLFGLDCIESKVLTLLNDKMSNIICLYGPQGCGKKSLIEKIKSDLTERMFILFDRHAYSTNKFYLKELFAKTLHFERNMVLYLPMMDDSYDREEINTLFYSIKYLKKDVKMDVLVTCKELPRGVSTTFDFIFVRSLTDCEKELYMNYLISKITGREETVDGINTFMKSLRGYTAGDISKFVKNVRRYYTDITIANLHKAIENKIYIPDKLDGVVANIEDLHWTDIGGYEHVKKLLKTKIQTPLLTGRSKVKGVTFYGPPGCSKTMFARALATECRVNLFVVRPSSIMASLLGESEARLREILIMAKVNAPSIIFFDEIETFIPGREQSSSSSVSARLLQELLLFMDGVETKKDHNVIVMCATNKLEQLDEALLRPGRMDLKIEIGLPDQESREAILRLIFADKEINVDSQVLGSITEIASKLDNMSGAAIVALGDQMKKWCRKQSKEVSAMPILTMDHVTHVINS